MAAMMPQRFELRWRGELTVLEALFGKEKLLRDLPRVREIHEYTELKWNEYADQLRDRVVRRVIEGDQEHREQALIDCIGKIRARRSGRTRGVVRETLRAAEARGDLVAARAAEEELNRFLSEKNRT